MYEKKDNTGSLWLEPKTFEGKNGQLYESYGGDCIVDGKEYWLNGFLNETKTGKKVYNLTFKLKQKREASSESIPF